jgi:Zn-dependent protease
MSAHAVVLLGIEYVALVLALCVHEFTHAALATEMGDETPRTDGRLTLSPLAHVDVLGTLALPLLAMVTGLPAFGWARPVRIQPGSFRRGWFRRGQVLVAAGGPLSNLAQALTWTVAYVVLTQLVPLRAARGTPVEMVGLFIEASIEVNIILAAFNILPVPPLDGSHVASWGLPRDLGEKYDAVVQPFGAYLLLVGMLPLFGGRSLFGIVLGPALHAAGWLIHGPWSGWTMTAHEAFG